MTVYTEVWLHLLWRNIVCIFISMFVNIVCFQDIGLLSLDFIFLDITIYKQLQLHITILYTNIWTQLYGFKYFYLIKIIYTQLYGRSTSGQHTGLQYHSKQVWTPVTLLHSLLDKYSWERYKLPYPPPSYGLNITTTGLLEGGL